ncbi:MAG: hypothetical protein EHM23_33420 [Acidobacteria bacterium]|nr:MAG: hypothetical protein EHM23_33420 [Acidobacteriota bacterium]
MTALQIENEARGVVKAPSDTTHSYRIRLGFLPADYYQYRWGRCRYAIAKASINEALEQAGNVLVVIRSCETIKARKLVGSVAGTIFGANTTSTFSRLAVYSRK